MAMQIKQENLVDITPDVRLLRVLRNSGFNNNTALGELLDNSVDAGANKIDVYVQEQQNKKVLLTIVDNGKGMSESALQYALTLAKELKVGIDQLGKFGMGMKTAALSMTTQMEIFTKTSHGDIFYGEFNMNKIEIQGNFKTTVRKANKEEEVFFKSKLGKSRSGTVILLKNCDRIGVKAETLMNQYYEYIGKTYRVFISRGVTFTISNTHKKGNDIPAIDPLMRNHEETIVIRDRETYPVDYRTANGNSKTTFIEVSATILPKPEKHGKVVNGKTIPMTINMANQGLYFLREGREVASAVSWVPVFGERHPSLNRVRLEIIVKSDLDDEIKMDWQKGNVFPTSKLKEQLGEIIKDGILKEIKEILDKDKKEKEDKKQTGSKTTVSPQNTDKKTEKGTPQQPFSTRGTSIGGVEKTPIVNKAPERQTTGVNMKEVTNPVDKNENDTYNDVLSATVRVKEALTSKSTPKEIKNKILSILGFNS